MASRPDPTQYNPGIDNVSTGALHNRVSKERTSQEMLFFFRFFLVDPHSRPPPSSLTRRLPRQQQAYADYKKNGTAGNEEDEAAKEAKEEEEEEKKYGKIYPRVWTKASHGGKYKISSGPGSRSGGGGCYSISRRPQLSLSRSFTPCSFRSSCECSLPIYLDSARSQHLRL
jgi:hypothetical protein